MICLAVVVVIVALVALVVWRAYRGRHDVVWMVMHAYAYYKKGQMLNTHDVPWRMVGPISPRRIAAGDKPRPDEPVRWVVVKVVDSMHIRVRPLPSKRSAA